MCSNLANLFIQQYYYEKVDQISNIRIAESSCAVNVIDFMLSTIILVIDDGDELYKGLKLIIYKGFVIFSENIAKVFVLRNPEAKESFNDSQQTEVGKKLFSQLLSLYSKQLSYLTEQFIISSQVISSSIFHNLINPSELDEIKKS
eukprot:TRINITY_DN49396_c0_g1_i2.p1 TRINITY_DN49396_c0_g1~~TRINITY_DN49396_c0_g1_i2.p1  ORF type:complete len:146 (+),score=17.17 TRINITY_DN49396_c0_g1_i2:319-756(+)